MNRKLRIASLVLAFMTLPAMMMAALPQGETPSEGQELHVFVGKSVVINVKDPITRVLSSNPLVVDTLATSPTQLVVEGKAAGVSSLVIWDGSGQSQMLDVTVDLNMAGLRSAIENAYPGERVTLQSDGPRVILTGSVSDTHISEGLTKMAGLYSTQVMNTVRVAAPHERQILLEVKFAEVDRTALTQFGVNFLSTGAANTVGTTTTGQYGSFGQQIINDKFGPSHEQFTSQETLNNVLNLFLFRPDIHLGAVIQALQQQSVLQILAEPNLLAVDGQKASFLAGGEFPFPIIQGTQNLGAVTIQFKPFGVKLDFVGVIGDDNVIRLHVAPEVSTLDFTNALSISGFTIPAISTRRAETEIELKDGQSFGIAGLLDNRAQTQLSKVPGIGDIPILGQLFRSRNVNRSNAELLVLVTPHIVDPAHSVVPPPATPKQAVPFLDIPDFDKTLPGNKASETPAKSSGSK
jgi:pilus assembly protein CpaC